MALGSMSVKRTTFAGDYEILKYSKFDGMALTLDTTAFTSNLCKAGTPIAANGTVANDGTAIGILLFDVVSARPQATIVIGGTINTSAAQTHSGVTIASTAKAALKNVIFG